MGSGVEIVCLEGPSAAGKTTLAAALSDAEDAPVVPEVNALFDPPGNGGRDWYLERQVERWSRAVAALRDHPRVVLDGDPFQPLWYGWVYDSRRGGDLDALAAFYRKRIRASEMAFPDRYMVLRLDEAELRRRREADRTRARRNFETHLRLIEPQRRYFEEMERLSPGRVVFLDAGDRSESLRLLRRAALQPPPGGAAPELFEALVEWLRTPEGGPGSVRPRC